MLLDTKTGTSLSGLGPVVIAAAASRIQLGLAAGWIEHKIN
jgi:hypothetical protein